MPPPPPLYPAARHPCASLYSVYSLSHLLYSSLQALLLQNLVLLVLIYHFQKRSVARTLTLLAVLGGWAALLSTGTLSRAHITALYDFNNVLLLVARVPQIAQSQSTRSTGQLSIVTYSLNVAGSAARIFTSIQENAGPAMLRGAVLSECTPPCSLNILCTDLLTLDYQREE